jgi:uncharacterized protein
MFFDFLIKHFFDNILNMLFYYFLIKFLYILFIGWCMVNVFESKSLDIKFLKQLKSDLSKYFKDCKRIAVKIHFGEIANTRAFTSKDVEPIMDVLEELKFEYFLYDSSITYGGPRGNPVTHKLLAKAKGFKNVELGDDFIEVQGDHMTYQVCKMLADADGVLILTHVKGHVCTGFGGAIKNLGMGALTAKTKQDIHDGGKPLFNYKCVKCGICIRNCPIDGLKLDVNAVHPIVKRCYGCSNCVYVCPHGVITPKVASFDLLLAEGALAAQSKFKRYYYVSMIRKVSKMCDCMPYPSKIIADDIGWLASLDGVAIDQASYDLIIKKSGEIFLKHNKKKGIEQIIAAEKLGMGKRKYVLKKLS